MNLNTFCRLSAMCWLLGLGGCAQWSPDASMGQAARAIRLPVEGELQWHVAPQQSQQARQAADALLDKPLSQTDAVRVMLLNSPMLQSILASHAADLASTARQARPALPLLSIKSLTSLQERELEKGLSLSLLDWLTWPQRARLAGQTQSQQRLQLTLQLADQVAQVRQAWVTAVAERQQWLYAQQVHEVAQISATLAERMQAAGNFSALQRDQQRLFFTDAVVQLEGARHASDVAQERLGVLLGLTRPQQARLRLPDQLPQVPQVYPMGADWLEQTMSERLDVQWAQAQYDQQREMRGLKRVSELVDVELGVHRSKTTEVSTGESLVSQGRELGIRLPWPDLAMAAEHQADAQLLQAYQQVEAVRRRAESGLSQTESAYRAAHALALHFQREALPLRQRISKEQLLRYNGMLIGVFDLLDNARSQVSTVVAALRAQQQFWLQDARLQAQRLGEPTGPLPVLNLPQADTPSAASH